MFDLIIIGGSAAATAAGIYAARRNLNFKIITKEFGGEVATSGEIGNWPGDGMTDGIKLADKFKEHLKIYNVVPEEGVWVKKVTKVEDPKKSPDGDLETGGYFCITADKDGEPKDAGDKVEGQPADAIKCDYTAKAVIITTGVHPRELTVSGEKEFRNKGVSYCTTCDGPLFSNKTVAVIGGGNSALEAGLMMAEIAAKVYVVNKNAIFKGDQILIDKLSKHSKVEILYEANTKEIIGDKFVASLKYMDKSGVETEIKVDGIFVHIGMIPNSNIVPENVEKNQFGEIKVNAKCETNIPGLYAAGDVTDVAFKQIVIAAGQGCTAVLAVVEYLNRRQ